MTFATRCKPTKNGKNIFVKLVPKAGEENHARVMSNANFLLPLIPDPAATLPNLQGVPNES
jgi:hypothetical protein